MGFPAARVNDPVFGVDIHIVMVPTPGGEAPTPLPHPYVGKVVSGGSTNVKVEGKPAAVVGSGARNDVNHVAQGLRFQKEPNNQGTVKMGSAKVKINKKPAARVGDPVETCNDPAPAPVAKIVAGAARVMFA